MADINQGSPEVVILDIKTVTATLQNNTFEVCDNIYLITQFFTKKLSSRVVKIFLKLPL